MCVCVCVCVCSNSKISFDELHYGQKVEKQRVFRSDSVSICYSFDDAYGMVIRGIV